MPTTKSIRSFLSNQPVAAWALTLAVALFLIAGVLRAGPGDPELKVLKTGLGIGTVTSLDGQINCGTICDTNYTSPPVNVVLNAVVTPGTNSTFVGWSDPACPGTGSCTVRVSTAKYVRAEFGLTAPINQITDFTPTGIAAYLDTAIHPENALVNTPARFIAALPPDFRQNWLLMTRSESLQTGTAQSPRILLPSSTAQFVFTIALTTDPSYPASHPNAIEYMQWDPIDKNFRFHEIVLADIPGMDIITPPAPDTPRPRFPARARHIEIDDSKCSKCHSTRNVINRTTRAGTTGTTGTTATTSGVVKAKNKPNWDAYDSWGGMMPFNRDRVYKGSVEEAAFRHIFNLWNWRNGDANDAARQILEQLELQAPWVGTTTSVHRITRNIADPTDAGHIQFGFDGLPDITTSTVSVGYSFNEPVATATDVTREGRYVTLRHNPTPRPAPLPPLPPRGPLNEDYLSPIPDEGRAVQFFDLLGGLDGTADLDGDGREDGIFNGQRIADELIDHRFATGFVEVDVRPVALAIIRMEQCLVINRTARTVTTNPGIAGLPALTIDLGFFDERHGMDVEDVLIDTRNRSQTLPQRKADNEKFNLHRAGDVYLDSSASTSGLIQLFGPRPTDFSLNRLRQEVFRRSIDIGRADETVMGRVYVDREIYGTDPNPASPAYTDLNTQRVALLRYFLEPLGVSVDKWSMSVRGRSRGYNFADVFGAYQDVLEPALESNLRAQPRGLTFPTFQCGPLIDAINTTLGRFHRTAVAPADAYRADARPTYTDVQRIFNKSCIECHGGLLYPPYRREVDPNRIAGQLDLSENETPPVGQTKMTRPHGAAESRAFSLTGILYQKITDYGSLIRGSITTSTQTVPYTVAGQNEDCPRGLMPCGGPPLSQADILTIRRWIAGGHGYSEGDPHIQTIDGKSYDFQSAGEFVVLRDENLEIQARQTPVSTAGPLGPNEHTGLTTCVSVNTAAAVRVGPHRITYQPNVSGEPDPSGLQLRIDGKLARAAEENLLGAGGRIIPTSAPGGIQIESPGGTVIVITPQLWEYYRVWWLHIAVRQARGTEGVMGAIAPGSWLPALPDGSSVGPLPRDDLHQRYVDLYERFENAWRVSDATTLFDYAPGTSTATFTLDSWPAENPQGCAAPPRMPGGPVDKPPLPPLPFEIAQQHCNAVVADARKQNCVKDVMATGEPAFAKAYLLTEQIERNGAPTVPALRSPENYRDDLAQSVTFDWNRATDSNNDPLTYKFCVWRVGDVFTLHKCVGVPISTSFWRRPIFYPLLVAVVGLLLLVILFVAIRPRRRVLGLIAVVIVLAVLIAFYIGRRSTSSGTLSNTVSGLESGLYFWKVIAEDNKGGSTESETRRFTVK